MSKFLDLISRGIPIVAPNFDEDGYGYTSTVMDEFLRGMDLATLPKIECSNVAEYLYTGTPQEQWDLRYDFPNLAPPFPAFWMEWKIPKTSNSEGKLIPNRNAECFSRNGFFFGSQLTTQVSPTNRWYPFVAKHPEAKWFVLCTSYLLALDGSLAMASNLLNANLVGSKGEWIDHQNEMIGEIPEELATDHSMSMISSSWTAWLAISFLHCKNVTIENEKVSDALRKATQKRTGVPLHRFKILNIEPMRKVLRKATPAGEHEDLKKSLHICRGHFKDFRKSEHGLFGKYKEIYWWESQVRGTVAAGIMDHEYKVKAPKP